ncbi:hypothetical protein ACIJV2_20225 [Clostridioides difficile]|nr:hypothetical protein [Clostridioides difficile]
MWYNESKKNYNLFGVEWSSITESYLNLWNLILKSNFQPLLAPTLSGKESRLG